MNTIKSRLIVTAAAITLLAALLSSIVSCAAQKQSARQDAAGYVPDTVSPPAKPAYPRLKIGRKKNPGVYLQSLDIQVEVTGNIASTRHTMVFKNKTNRVLEGELVFPLPDGRSVTFYALDINGKMREAVPVEKAKATEVFEEIERRQVDPGLLEKVAGNNFRTRVYPIPANGTRTISIGYEEELPLENGSLRYRLPLDYPNPIEKFSVKATVWKSGVKPLVSENSDELIFDKAGENYAASFARENYQAAGALGFALPAPADVPRVVVQPARWGSYFFASVAPNLKTRRKRWDKDLAIIWDVSLSGSQRDLKREMEVLDIIFAERKNADAYLYFLNNRLTKMANKNTANGEHKVRNGNWDGLRSILKKAVFDGGTDFSRINLDALAGKEILFFSDGLSTLSDADFIKNAAVKRPIHCVVSSAGADYSAMRLIAGKTRGKFVNVSELSSERLREELLNEAPQFLGTEHGKAVREVYPSIATPVHGNFSLAGISDADEAELTLLFGLGDKVKKRIKIRLDAKNADGQGNVHKLWARKKIAELDLNYEKNRAELTEMGRQFGIVTRNTSLIVLETVEDYIRYNIEPPPELQAEYQRELKKRDAERCECDTKRDMLKEAAAAAQEIRVWWNTDFTPPEPEPDSGGVSGIGYGAGGSGFGGGSGGIDDMLGGLMGGGGGSLEIRHRGSLHVDSLSAGDVEEEEEEEEKYASPTITLKTVREDNDYLNELTGKTAEDYQIYLKLRDDYAGLPTFYFDMADWFYTRGDKKTALRVLTSIAELELEDASLYRLLGYRLKEYGEYALEKFVCQKVIQWRPMDPQSYRDYALALADDGEAQAALDSLYAVLARPYSQSLDDNVRSGIGEIVVTEMSRLLAENANLNTSRIDTNLIINIPVDIRVVINWNMGNTDIDLHVIDPDGEECFYSRTKTNIGGRISADNTNGYGPEQFLLKKAVKGKYQVYVNYFNDRRFTEVGPATVMAEIFTKYADKTEQRRVVCFQRSKVNDDESSGESDGENNGRNNRINGSGKVLVAEFEF